MGTSNDEVFNGLGYFGGVLLAVSLLPQIFLAHKRRSASDISYTWQVVYILGLTALMLYYANFRLWPVFIPMVFEATCIVYLTFYKIYLEVQSTSRQKKHATGPRPRLSRTDSIKELSATFKTFIMADIDGSGSSRTRGLVGVESADGTSMCSSCRRRMDGAAVRFGRSASASHILRNISGGMSNPAVGTDTPSMASAGSKLNWSQESATEKALEEVDNEQEA